ncbi:MAG: hypothetical protein M1305_06440 [Candidatus Marsarchaeota archaeon]|nr:hypothetical protein [Candidatus Marsarchaeota archaeon]
MTDWVAIGAIATGTAAAATAVAAGFTAYMAKQTKKSAQAAENSVFESAKELKVLEMQTQLLAEQTSAITGQTQLARMALTRGDRPLLIPVAGDEQTITTSAKLAASNSTVTLRTFGGATREWPAHGRGSLVATPWGLNDPSVWVIIDMRNVGTGLAMLRNPTLDLTHGLPGGRFSSPLLSDLLQSSVSQMLWPQQPVVPPGENTLFVARIDDPEKNIWQRLSNRQVESTPNTIDAEFYYQDLSRSATYSVFITFSISDDLGWLIPGTPTFTGYDLPEMQIDSKDPQK